jgi:hypothetical protein
MGLFRRDKRVRNEISIPIAPNDRTEEEALVEIVAHQDAKKEIIDEAKKVNAHLKDLLVQNGFTIKIYLAAGGNPPNKKNEVGKK